MLKRFIITFILIISVLLPVNAQQHKSQSVYDTVSQIWDNIINPQKDKSHYMYEYTYNEDILLPLTLFGGLKNDTYFIDILKWFDNLPSVNSIKVSWVYNGYASYRVVQNSHQNYKNKIQNNLLYDLISSNWSEFKDFGVRNYTFENSSNMNALTSYDFSFEIDYVVIENIPFKVEIELKPQLEKYYYHKNNDLKTYNGVILPFDEITKIKFTSLTSVHNNLDILKDNRQNLLNLYAKKYQKYLNKNPLNRDIYYCDDNVLIRINESSTNIEITYSNLHFDYYNDKYNNEVKNNKMKKYAEQNSSNKI